MCRAYGADASANVRDLQSFIRVIILQID